jgi:phosphoribosylaminoimidazolecarboxamide formyltransferase / IMP cyclohydrolase
MIKRALISVSDKQGIVEFARELSALGVEIISTGGTSALLEKNAIPVRPVSQVTGFPEILDGRVKTLQPAIHGGILAIRDKPEHMEMLKAHGIGTIDLVVVNLYPFKETIQKKDVTLAEAIENIDIGGPTMIRSAAKNYRDVTVLVNPFMYGKVLEALRSSGGTTLELRYALAVEAFSHTGQYDAFISQYLYRQLPEGSSFPPVLNLSFEKVQDLHYGENPHQKASFYRDPFAKEASVATATQLHGRDMSFNNVNDANAALELVKEFSEPAVVAIKHANPCGVGTGVSLVEAYEKAFASDPISIFGGIIAVNRTMDAETAREINKIFVEIVIAPGYMPDALEVLAMKKNIRILEVGPLRDGEPASYWDMKKVNGGLLVQDADTALVLPENWRVVSKRAPTEKEIQDLLFAWKVVKHTKSNAIIFVQNGGTVGVGAGQMNRVGSARIAAEQAGEKAAGAVMASDAFFPFPDSLEVAAAAGVTAVVHPGGSVKDDESIAAADAHGMAMVLTGMRHFRH